MRHRKTISVIYDNDKQEFQIWENSHEAFKDETLVNAFNLEESEAAYLEVIEYAQNYLESSYNLDKYEIDFKVKCEKHYIDFTYQNVWEAETNKNPYTLAELQTISSNMIKYGGSFMTYIGKALERADVENIRKLVAAFPDECKQYLKY